jgi:Tfp pilus assembly protein PilO
MNKTRQWTMLTAVACLAILAAGWFLAVKPQRSHAASLRTQTQTVQQSNEQLTTQVNQLKQQQKDLPAQQKVLSQIATKIPDNPALPALIRQLSSAADGAGVNLISLAPGTPIVSAAPAAPVTTGTSTGTTSTGTTPSSSAASPLASIPLTLQVQGSYFNVEQFFSAVESLSRAMLVTGFNVTPATGGGAGAGSDALAPGTLQAQITAQVFESPQAAAAATAPATSTSPTTTTGH